MKRVLILTGITIVALLIVTAAALVVRSRIQSARTQELIAQWQAVGGAMSLAEMKPEPIADDQNAAVLYEQAFAELSGWTEVEAQLVKELILNDASIAVIAEARPAIEKAIEAGRRPDCDWGTDIFESLDPATFPRYREPRRLSNLLTLAAMHAVKSDDPDRAVELLSAARNLSAHIAGDPGVPAALASVAIDARALGPFQELFADRALPDRTDEFTAVRYTDDRRRWLVLTEGSVTLDHVIEHHDDRFITLSRHRDIQHGLRCGLRALEALEKPVGSLSSYEKFDEIPGGTRISAGLLGILVTVDENLRRMHRWELAAQTAVDLRRYRDEHGEYPEPDQWDMPIDPLSHKPMMYRRTDVGFEITGSLDDDEHPLLWQWQ